MNWQVQPSSNASVVPGGDIRFIDVSGEVVRIDGSFLRYGRGLVSGFRKAEREHAAAFPKGAASCVSTGVFVGGVLSTLSA